MQESDAPTTTISSMDVISETNEEWKNLQSLEKEKEDKNLYNHLHLDPFFSCGLRQVTEKNILPKYQSMLGRDSFSWGPQHCLSSIQPWITSERMKQLHYQMEPPTSYLTSSTVPQLQVDVQRLRPVSRYAQTLCFVHLQLSD